MCRNAVGSSCHLIDRVVNVLGEWASLPSCGASTIFGVCRGRLQLLQCLRQPKEIHKAFPSMQLAERQISNGRCSVENRGVCYRAEQLQLLDVTGRQLVGESSREERLKEPGVRATNSMMEWLL